MLDQEITLFRKTWCRKTQGPRMSTYKCYGKPSNSPIYVTFQSGPVCQTNTPSLEPQLKNMEERGY